MKKRLRKKLGRCPEAHRYVQMIFCPGKQGSIRCLCCGRKRPNGMVVDRVIRADGLFRNIKIPTTDIIIPSGPWEHEPDVSWLFASSTSGRIG